MGVGGQRHSPAALPKGKTRYPLCWRLGRPRAGLDGCGKSRPKPGFDPRTVQPVASRYTDWAIPAATIIKRFQIFFFLEQYKIIQVTNIFDCRVFRESHYLWASLASLETSRLLQNYDSQYQIQRNLELVPILSQLKSSSRPGFTS